MVVSPSDPTAAESSEWNLNKLMPFAWLAWVLFTVLTGWSRDHKIEAQQRQIEEIRAKQALDGRRP